MKLYQDPYSPNCRRVGIFIAEKGLAIEMSQVALLPGDNLKPPYLSVTSNGLVPALETDGGSVISESSAICRYIEELHPSPNLLGESPLERASIEMWDRRADFEGMLPLAENFRNRFPPYADRAIPGTAGEPQISQLVERGRRTFLRFYDHLDGQLDKGGFVIGNRLTLADISAMCVVDFALFCEIPIPSHCTRVSSWYPQMESRKSALAAPGMVAQLGNYSKIVG